MKSLSSKTYQCGVTIQGLTTLSGTVYLTGITNTGSWDHVIVGTTAQGQIYTRTYAQFMGDIATGISLSSYVTGSGTTNYLPKFTGTSTIGNSVLQETSGNIQLDNTSAVYIANSSSTSYFGGLSIRQSGTERARFAANSDEGAYIYSPTFAGFSILSNAGTFLRLSASGNLGLGTTSPSYKLQVNADGAGLYVLGANSSPYTQTIATFVYGGNSNSINIENQGGKASIQARAGGSTMDLLLNPAGSNVVIGTTTPFTIGGTAKVSIYADAPSTYGLSSTDAVYLRRYGVGEYQFQTTASGGNNGNLSLQSYGGNVGIGTTSPSYLLDVQQVIRSKYGSNEGGIYLGGTPAGVAYVAGAVRATPSPSYSYTGKLSFYTTTWGVGTDYGITEQMYIDVTGSDTKAATLVMLPWGGNVGIGTTSPLFNLQVGSNAGTIATTTIRLQNSYLDTNGYYGFNIDAVDNGVSGHDLRFLGRSSPTGTFSELVRIKNTGNVGIGTTTPNEKLHVAGNINAYVNGGIDAGLFASTSAGSTTIALRSNGITHFNGGSVGIGTASPTQKLDVAGNISLDEYLYHRDSAAQYLRFIDTSTIQLQSAQINFSLGSTSAPQGGDFQFASPNGSDFTVSYTRTGQAVWKQKFVNQTMYWENNVGNVVYFANNAGNVGIGTTSPAYKLDVSGALRATGTVYSDNGSLAGALNLGQVVSIGSSFGSYANLIFTMHNGGGFSDIMKLQGNGNVGIGTNSPTKKLHVYTADNEGIFLQGAGGGVWMDIQASGGQIHSVGAQVGGMGIYNRTSSSYRMFIADAGNFGIGNTSPSTLLDVSGVITATGGNSTNWNTAYGWGNHSSAGYVPQARTLTINGTSYDLSANRSWTIATTTNIQEAANNGKVTTAASVGTTVITTVATATYDGATFNYVLKDGTNYRAGTIIAVWSAGAVQFNETTTNDIGSTVGVTFAVALNAGNAELRATSATSGWTVKAVTIGI